MVFANTTKEPDWEPVRRAVAANVGAIRRAIGRKPGAPYKKAPSDGRTTAGTALSDLDAALARLAVIYGRPPSQDPESQVSIAAKDDSAVG